MIAIINYDAGNLASVSNALNRLQADYVVTKNIDQLNNADAVIFPGVGHAKPAMQSLRENGLDAWLQDTQKPVLGICLGMQLLYESSEEGGGTEGLGLIPGRLKKFDNSQQKVPHMGWNTCQSYADHPLVENIDENDYFYFVHSFYAPVNEYTLATGHYINDFAAIVARKNIMGAQFHPEKSGDAGHRLLSNFLRLVKNLTDIK